MKIIETVDAMRDYVAFCAKRDLQIGFVPTMGALHKGHVSLIKAARKENDVVVVSIFVNPLQFCMGEDYDRYPRQPETDKKLCDEEGVDVLFVPSVAQMYPKGFDTFVDQAELTKKLCGPFRPGHFRGMLTIVVKLFNIVRPNVAYLGQKDYQQYLIITRMAQDLDYDITVRLMPTLRDEDGMAISSRNAYLGPKQRKEAASIYRALMRAKELIQQSESSVQKIVKEMKKIITEGIKGAKIDYVEIVNSETLDPIREIKGSNLIAVAVRIGKARLIDNILIE
jgi:pantoate--beta-alanine ligase